MAAGSAGPVGYQLAPLRLGTGSLSSTSGPRRTHALGDPPRPAASGQGRREADQEDQDEDREEPLEPLRRADTASIVGAFQGAGASVVLAGLALAAVYFAIAAVLVWYSTQVPRTCRVGLGTTFRLMGSLDGVVGVLMVCFFLAAKGLVDAMSHRVLAEKYESEGRTEEAEWQKEEAAKKMAGVFLQGCFPTLGFCLLRACLLATWVYGIVQAADADQSTCGSAATVFWVMLAANVASACVSSCLETSPGVRSGIVPDEAAGLPADSLGGPGGADGAFGAPGVPGGPEGAEYAEATPRGRRAAPRAAAPARAAPPLPLRAALRA